MDWGMLLSRLILLLIGANLSEGLLGPGSLQPSCAGRHTGFPRRFRSVNNDQQPAGLGDIPYEFEQVRWYRSLGTRPVYTVQSSLTSSERRLLPIFPLDDGCAFPTGVFPLLIFALPYRAMMNDLYSNSDKTGAEKLFGICMSDGQGGVAEIGVGLEIIDRTLKPDGRQVVSTVCRQRFKVVKIVQEEPYIIAEVEYGVADIDIPNSESTDEIGPSITNLEKEIYQLLEDVCSLSKALKIYGKDTEVSLPAKVVLLSPKSHSIRKSVAELFSFAIGDFLNLGEVERQVLLQSYSLEYRLQRLKRLLQPARDSLLDKMALKEASDAFGDD